MEILSVENLNFTFPGQTEPVIKETSFSLEKGTFAVLAGPTGSGKTTLLKLLKRELRPNGTISGRMFFRGTDINSLGDRTAAFKIGFVSQMPEQQIVSDKVWHELAFGLENLGTPRDEIRRRVSEMACFFGIEDWFDKHVSELSGGQKQLLNLAAVMVMQPEILLLDEPTAQLDPIAAADFIGALQKLNRELSLTVLLCEHRLEEVVPVCDRLMLLTDGRLIFNDTPRRALHSLKAVPELLEDMPSAVKLYARLSDQLTDTGFYREDILHADQQEIPLTIREGSSGREYIPLTVREGREFLEKHFSTEKLSGEEQIVRTEGEENPEDPYRPAAKKALEFSDVMFRYEKNADDIISHMDLTVHENEVFCILGGNGSGKSTSLLLSAGLLRPYRGKIRVFEKDISAWRNQELYRECLAMLPQDVSTLFLENTVANELKKMHEPENLEGWFPFDLSHLKDQHPYDLSGGEMQLLGMMKVLSEKPRILLMDEPTKGLDPASRRKILEVVRHLKKDGKTLVIVTHDVEFAAAAADRCAFLFRGEIVSCDVPRRFFSDNYFYTTAVSRMTKGLADGIVTLEDAEKYFKRQR